MFTPAFTSNPGHLVCARTLAVRDLFAYGDMGLLVPHTFRGYVWNEVQVNQFMHDLCQCVTRLVDDATRLHFLGPITLLEGTVFQASVKRLEPYANPARIYTILDGQQRLATIALLTHAIYRRLNELRPLTYEEKYQGLREIIDDHQEALFRVFSFNLGRGFPWHKPVLIHGHQDQWVEMDNNGHAYQSTIGSYLARALLALNTDKPVPSSAGTSLERPLLMIEQWLNLVAQAHLQQSDSYPNAWQIRSGLHLSNLHFFSHPEITAAAATGGDPGSPASQLCALTQLVTLSYTLLQCCCFVVITSTTGRMAMDMYELHDRLKVR